MIILTAVSEGSRQTKTIIIITATFDILLNGSVDVHLVSALNLTPLQCCGIL